MVAQHTPAAIATHRARWLAKWIKVAESLKSEELALKTKMPSEMRKILEPKKLLLWEAILTLLARSVELLKGKSSGAVWVGKTPFRDQISFQLCDETPVFLTEYSLKF